MKILATICARGGSQGVKNKNIRSLQGKPLIAYSIEQLIKWGKADDIVCSTDSDIIAEVAKKFGAQIPFKRPDYLATSEASKIPVIKHALEFMELKNNTKYDVVVDLDPTAPLRKIEFIQEAFNLLVENNLNTVFSVCLARKNPYFNMVELDEKNVPRISKPLDSRVVRRQDAKAVYEANASIYIYDAEFLRTTDNKLFTEQTMIYEMPEEYSIDIDREIDFKYIEFLLKEGVVAID